MATVTAPAFETGRRPDVFSGTPRAHAVDRWIYVFTAASFILICLAGFIPDSLMKIADVEAGRRPPFPLVLHAHAVLMGSFLVLLLGQTWMMATGRKALHMKLGVLGVVLGMALIVVGFMLVTTNYHMLWAATQSGPAEARAGAAMGVHIWENIMLIQIRIGLLFALFLGIAVAARNKDAGLHKRMVILATAMALPAGHRPHPVDPAYDAREPVVAGSIHAAGGVADARLGRRAKWLSAQGLG